MKKQLMAVAIAGSLGIAGVGVPRLVSAQAENQGPEPGAEADSGGWQPGMMGGDCGMMRGRGHGGMMDGALGFGPIWRLDLSDQQRTDLRKLQGDFRRANWTTIGNLIDARQKLRDVETAAEPDPKQVGAAFADVSRLEQTLIQARAQTRNQALALLTPVQRQQLDKWRQQGRGPAAGLHRHGPGMMGH